VQTGLAQTPVCGVCDSPKGLVSGSKSVSHRETADTTVQASAPAALPYPPGRHGS